MSEFTVGVGEIAAAAARLGSISADVQDAGSRMIGHASAGAGTSGEAAVTAFVTGFARALPQFGLSVERLHGAVSAGGQAYAHTEEGIAAASQRGGERP